MESKSFENNTYSLILDYKIKEGEILNQVKSRLTSLLKANANLANKLFNRSPIILKKGLSIKDALKYKLIIEKTGAICYIKEEEIRPDNSNHCKNNSLIQKITKEGWLSLGIGLVLAALIFLFPFINYVLGYLNVLIHEIGHSIFAWLFGYPSIPTFDFRYGGGFALQFKRQGIIIIVIYALFGFLFYRYRKNWLSLTMLSVLVLLYSCCVFSRIHHIIILYMGEGTEPIFAGLLLFRAITWRKNSMGFFERPLNALFGFFILLSNIQFAWQIFSNPHQLALYTAAQKGGSVWNDFVLIANSYLQ
jgi:hypothetical protein